GIRDFHVTGVQTCALPISIREIADWEYGLENGLQAFFNALVGTSVLLQELIVGALLHLDQVRHRTCFGNLPERLTDTLLTGVGQSHLFFPMRAALSCGPRPLGPPSAAHEPPLPPWLRTREREPDPSFRTSRAGDIPAHLQVETRKRRKRRPFGPLLPSNVCELLQIDLRTGLFKLGLELFGIRLVHAFLHRLRRAFNEVLGFLQAETRDRADFLDVFDLLVASAGELDRELGLLFSRRTARSSATANSSNGDRRSGRNAPLFFQHLR